MSDLDQIQALASIVTDAGTTIIFLWLYMRERETTQQIRTEQLKSLYETLAYERRRSEDEREANQR